MLRMSSVIEVRKRILTDVFLDPRTIELLNQTIRTTQKKDREYGFEVNVDYSNYDRFHSRFVKGITGFCPLDIERLENPLDGDLVLSVHSHTKSKKETLGEQIRRAKNATDSSTGDLLRLVNDYRSFRRQCAQLAGTEGENGIADQISPISMVVYPVVAIAHLHLYQLTGHVPEEISLIDEWDAEPTLERMEQRGQLQRMKITYKDNQYEGLDESVERLALTEPLQLEAPEPPFCTGI
tara:strand:+ start:589 stop:1302 length:714 start_codon:yes stop_codon:yes gene_type:complete